MLLTLSLSKLSSLLSSVSPLSKPESMMALVTVLPSLLATGQSEGGFGGCGPCHRAGYPDQEECVASGLYKLCLENTKQKHQRRFGPWKAVSLW